MVHRTRNRIGRINYDLNDIGLQHFKFWKLALNLGRCLALVTVLGRSGEPTIIPDQNKKYEGFGLLQRRVLRPVENRKKY